MSNLVLRANLSRPLTHNELDANMQFLEIVEWSAKDFRAGQFAYISVTGTTTLYLCLETHTAFVYDNNGGEFAETITIDGTPITLWRKISGSGGGTGAEFVNATFDPDTNILTFTTADSSTVTVDLSSLAGGGTGTSGTSGFSGSSGTSGARGTSGTSGEKGTSGTSGGPGSSGTSGGPGSSGTSGNNGSSGTSGMGTSGSSGSSGNGTAGSSGNSGSSGTSGARGTSGTSGGPGSSGTSGQSDKYLGNVLTGIDYSILTVGTPLVVNTTPDLSYSAGQSIVIAYDISNYAEGTVITYNPNTGQLAIDITNIVWNTAGNVAPSTSNLQGTIGPSGSSGSSGESGTSGVGSPGTSGSAGTSGAAGAPGTSGTSAAGGGSGVYFMKLQYSSGSLASAPGCFVAAEDPSGNDLLVASGWVFTRVGANEVTITHPLGKFAINAMTHAENTSGNYLSKAVSGASTGVNSLIQPISTKDTMNFKALSGTQTGLNTGAGPYYMYVTWTFPDNDFAI